MEKNKGTSNNKKSNEAKDSSNSSNSNNKTDDYVINRKANEFHLKDKNCTGINGIELKYINEITATREDLINVGLISCKNCIDSE